MPSSSTLPRIGANRFGKMGMSFGEHPIRGICLQCRKAASLPANKPNHDQGVFDGRNFAMLQIS